MKAAILGVLLGLSWGVGLSAPARAEAPLRCEVDLYSGKTRVSSGAIDAVELAAGADLVLLRESSSREIALTGWSDGERAEFTLFKRWIQPGGLVQQVLPLLDFAIDGPLGGLYSRVPGTNYRLFVFCR